MVKLNTITASLPQIRFFLTWTRLTPMLHTFQSLQVANSTLWGCDVFLRAPSADSTKRNLICKKMVSASLLIHCLNMFTQLQKNDGVDCRYGVCVVPYYAQCVVFGCNSPLSLLIFFSEFLPHFFSPLPARGWAGNTGFFFVLCEHFDSVSNNNSHTMPAEQALNTVFSIVVSCIIHIKVSYKA